MKKTGHTSLVWMAITILLMVMLASGIPVEAQTVTTVVVSPQNSNLQVGSQVTLDFMVTAGANINAYDITVTYNSNFLSLVSWQHGDYLSNLAVVKLVNNPGSFQLVCTQLARPGVSGDGILLKLVFQGLTIGSSPVIIENIEFADPLGNSTFPASENGLIDVRIVQITSPTATSTLAPTITQTKAPTLSQTTTPMSSPTITPTQIPSQTSTTVGVAPGETAMIIVPPNAEDEMITSTAASETEDDDNNMVNNQTEINDNLISEANPQNVSTSGLALNEKGEPGGNQSEIFLWLTLFIGIIILAFLCYLLVLRKKKTKREEYFL